MNPIYVGDVVEVIKAALESSGSCVLNVAGDETVSIRDLAEEIGRIVGEAPVYVEGTADVSGDLVCANGRMHELLPGTQLVRLADGLERMVRELEPTH